MTRPQPKAGIMNINAYVGGEGRGGGADPLRLASNENPLGCSPAAIEAYQRSAATLHRYPDPTATELRLALGRQHGIDAERIVCGNGSDELITLITRAYAGPGDEIVHSAHGFLMYAINAHAVGATPVAAPEKNLRTDVAAVLAAVTPKTKIVMLANPNNPTGSYLTRDEMKHLRDKLPPQVLLVIDAAYAEFVDAEDYDDGNALVSAHDNVVALRTFSKLYGLAALRLGWGYFPADMVGVINRIRCTFSINAPAQAAGMAALADRDFVTRTLDMTRAGRSLLAKGFEKMGLRVYPSAGNFLLVEFGPRAEQIRQQLRDQDIFIRQMGAYGLPHCLRVTIGTEADNDRLLEAVRGLL